MKITCDVIRDILPLYAEEMVSQDTKNLVEEHLIGCEGCTRELDDLRKPRKLPVETDASSLKRVGKSIRRRRILAVMAVLLFVATLLIGGSLMLDATIYLSAEEAVKDIYAEGDTVKIVWDNCVIGTGAQTETEDQGNYAVAGWTNLMKLLVPTEKVPYDMLDEEVKVFISREEYDMLDNTSTYALEPGNEGTNFWYCDLSKGSMKLILDAGMPHPDTMFMKDGNRIRGYVYGLAILSVICMVPGILLKRFWYGQLLNRIGILAGSCALSAVIVTAGQLVDVYGRFTEMLVDSSAVAIPMTLCGFCVYQLLMLNRKDKGL